MKESKTIKQYSDRIMATVNNKRLLGMDFSDSRVVEKVITTLPKRGGLADRRRTLKELFKQELEKVLAQIRELRNLGLKEGTKQRKKLTKKQAEGGFHHAFTARRPITWRNFARPGQTYSAKAVSNMVIMRIFVEIMRRYKLSQYKPRLLKICKAQEERVFTASCFAANRKCSWLVDSDCSHHMAADESLFKDLDKGYVSKVRISNGNLIEVKGRGNVVINTRSGNKVISDVLYVPEIDQNLLSVG
ncbi:uncharacterized protein [Gossypium hirsutum]|uniref:Retrovirus-related Pol polyprotein from transposon TNT 1-94-like beta-barrel domain-containing protein n=1 Tax=Gossypium hirsutum TaxID=3635 RepID=A0A1U8JJV5_GOSHI|nr:uncharacterized protein LOC107907753 [Gossypium hirsutum]